MNAEVTSASLLAITSSISTFTSLAPDLADVRKAVGDPALTADVRLGELTATAVVVAIGVAASVMVKSPIPGMIAATSAAGLVLMYESVLQSVPVERKAT